ncbi:MAG: hypothetical protein AAF581_16110 [Planctomycetota bacterium]
MDWAAAVGQSLTRGTPASPPCLRSTPEAPGDDAAGEDVAGDDVASVMGARASSRDGFSLGRGGSAPCVGEGALLGRAQSGSEWFRLCEPRSDLQLCSEVRRHSREQLTKEPQLLEIAAIAAFMEGFGPR